MFLERGRRGADITGANSDASGSETYLSGFLQAKIVGNLLCWDKIGSQWCTVAARQVHSDLQPTGMAGVKRMKSELNGARQVHADDIILDYFGKSANNNYSHPLFFVKKNTQFTLRSNRYTFFYVSSELKSSLYLHNVPSFMFLTTDVSLLSIIQHIQILIQASSNFQRS